MSGAAQPQQQYPADFRRQVEWVEAQKRGYLVHFECGHERWFSSPIVDTMTYPCRECYELYHRQQQQRAGEV
jgi:hypothetical protein